MRAFVGVELDVVVDGVGRETARCTPRASATARRSACAASRGRRAYRLRGLLTDCGSVRMSGNLPAQFPGLEERRPVDVVGQLRDRTRRNCARRASAAPAAYSRASRAADPVGTRLRQRDTAEPSAPRCCSRRGVFALDAAVRLARVAGVTAAADADRARGILYIDHGAVVLRRRSSPPCVPGRWWRPRSAADARSPGAASPRATCTISSSDGVIRPDRPMMSASSSAPSSRIFRRHHDARGRSLRSCCTGARRRRCSCRCRAHRP